MDKEGNATGDHEEALQYALAVCLEEDMEEDVEDDEEDEEDGEVDEEDEDEDENTFSFKDGVNPLDFVEDDAFGDQVYEQFVGMGYEALAERKRKALEDSRPEGSVKKVRHEDVTGASMEEIMEAMNYGMQRRTRKPKKKGRRKGSKKKLTPEITRRLGEATLHYVHGHYEEAIPILAEIVKQAPDLSETYHTLGLVHDNLGNELKALNCFTIAALLAPKNPALWELLFGWFNRRGDTHKAIYCLSRAISADPKNIDLKLGRASLYVKLGDYHKAAASYEQIVQACPDNVEALKTGAVMYDRSGQHEHSIHILEAYLRDHPTKADPSVIDLLASILMENNAHNEAIQHIEHAQLVFCSNKEMPLTMKIKAGICHAYLGNMEKAETLFSALEKQSADQADLIAKVADSFMSLGHYSSALKYYLMLKGNTKYNKGFLHMKIARCHLSLNDRVQAILWFYEAVKTLEDNIEIRLTLASILLEEAREDEAILLLSPPKNLDRFEAQTNKSEPWWCNGNVELKLCYIYRAKGMLKEFVDAIYPLVHESLRIESLQQKVKVKKRLTKSVLLERVKVLDDHQTDNLLCRSRPVAPASDLLKAARAKKLLQKKAKVKEEKRAEAMAAGVDWQSDDSGDDPPEEIHQEPPLPDLLKDKENHGLIIDLCKSLASLHRYCEALEIINLALKSTRNMCSVAEELRSLGAQIAYNTPDPEHGVDCVKYIADQHPYSNAAWNCYYKVITRLDDWYARHYKFLRGKRDKLKDCVPPSIISGHHFTKKSRHQDAAREYLEAYKLLPENPLINLCVGTALINLALGHRLQNRHQCVAQGLAFLYKNLQLCEFSQEAFFNIGRAYHHVGLVTLAAWHYDKVLAMHMQDYPIPKLPHEKPESVENLLPGYCDLRKEAAFNLHLMYKKSGAVDLARQVLRDHCTF
ncbi:general transcription factor 3C polypeptide 3-like [Prunus avium]|uniref:General transcription factor 3C polypeptide 3-like n=1 Tax=Prunus avium TaxID=42229 RepID=A0A6P5RBN5_PRUAV|nr:general transcription factor 3C polypeptide 3-like [Prunus avium]XP_021800156.1 general transcription factor 3C polypeptide 3-like [Prunus avium]XP_021800158.1 general transcription factor 3C polypeptide 3-like [Prunus avium]XP_021800159.1 general transcription factor 3C polypeptide 3-like [Prunus avium]XP_021800160.1 general transcription factor 3C polypeptide 3-like [Prunus avium]XP_021800161.1 general transcription factor 3C polypeptide 3-like [Prunus avium]XP_021800162.1 general transc